MINYSVSQGLPSSEIYQALQDKQGFIWFTTNQGVSRFNGYEFQNYTTANGLPNNSILEIYEDYKGRIWFISLSCQLAYFYKGVIHTYPYNEAIQKKIKPWIPSVKLSFYVDKNENVYLSAACTGIVKISAKGELTLLDAQNEYYPKYALAYYVNTEKILVGLPQYDNIMGISILKNGQYAYIHVPLNSRTNRVWALPYNNKTILGYICDLHIIENQQVVQKYNFPSEIIWMSKEGNNDLWVSLKKKGVYLFLGLHHFSHPDGQFLQGLTVTSVVKDMEGAYWFTTLEKGVFYMPSKDIMAYTTSSGLKATKITTIDEYQGDIWFAGNHSEIYKIHTRNLSKIDYFKNDGVYYQFIKNGHGKLFMAGGLPRIFDIVERGHLKRIGISYFKNIYLSDKKDEFYALYFGIIKYKNDKPVFDSLLNKINNLTFCMLPNPSGGFWIGTDDGLLLLKNGQREYLGQKNSLLKHRINDLVYSPCGLWIATKGDGLLLKQHDTIIQFTTRNGMPGTSVNSLYIDGDDLWIGTTQGLARLEIDRHIAPSLYKITSFHVTDGLISNEINKVHVQGNMVYMATNEGFCFFDKTKLRPNQVAPPVYVQAIKINDKDTVIQVSYSLPFDLNNITIEYNGLSYRNAGKIDYIYNMEGIDSVWRITKSRVARFPLLPPGKYTFRVKASNTDGVVSYQPLSFTFIIQKPYWQTWWFRVFVVFVISAVSFFIFYLINRIKIKEQKRRMLLKENLRKSEQEVALSGMKLRYFANISHEIRTPLTLIINPLQDIIGSLKCSQEQNRQLDLIYSNAKRLKELTDQILDLQKIDNGNLRLYLSNDDIVLFVKGIISSFEEYCNKTRCKLIFTSEFSSIYCLFDKDKISKILSNLLTNAFKYSNTKGNIEVRLVIDADWLILTVKDKGRGIPKEHLGDIFKRFYQLETSNTSPEGAGIGLAYVKELVGFMKGNVGVKSEVDKGTEVQVSIPLTEIKIIDPVSCETEIKPTKQPVLSNNIQNLLTDENGTENLRSILIAEDNIDLQYFIGELFKDEFKVIYANNGNEGIKKALHHLPDIIISDIMMPGTDGMELCSTLKQDEQTSHIPIILLTAKGQYENHMEGYLSGADDYIIKPFDSELLKLKVRNIISTCESVRNQFNANLGSFSNFSKYSDIDRLFLTKCFDVIYKHIDNSNFTIGDLSKELSFSRRNLYRKLQALTNQNPAELIKTIRMKHAANLLQTTGMRVSEVAQATGYDNTVYFSQLFKKQFGALPSEFNKN
jgi:signal transduction histidine kinase/DNA-binding response OmpR family regulator/ligand-binding sensor domain-containing protein